MRLTADFPWAEGTVHIMIGVQIVGFSRLVPALRSVVFAQLGELVIGIIWLPRNLRAMGVATALVLVPAFPVSAQTNAQLIDWCNGSNDTTPEQSINGCTGLIQSGKYAGDELAIVFSNRGVAHFRNGESERAIQDYDQAILLNPNFVDATIARGFDHLEMNSYDPAIADFNTTLKAHPENAPSLYGRGLANRARGDAAGASADLTAARRLDPIIAQELSAWGFNPGSPEAVPFPAAPVVTSALQEQRTVPSTPVEKAASLPPAAAPAPSSEPNAVPSTPEQKTASLPAEVIKALIKRGDELFSTGDIVGARFGFERAAAGGSSAAAIRVAKTYDPAFLSQAHARGLRADPALAVLWYEKAAAAGDREAEEGIKRLRAEFPTVINPTRSISASSTAKK
jgi:hypothetical protein